MAAKGPTPSEYRALRFGNGFILREDPWQGCMGTEVTTIICGVLIWIFAC